MNILELAIIEEERRRVETVKEIDKLSKIVQQEAEIYANNDLLKDKALAKIDYDIDLANRLREYLKSHESSNELYGYTADRFIEAFLGARNILLNDYDYLINDAYSDKYVFDSNEKTILGIESNNSLGTSIPNFVQIALFTILTVADNYHKFTDIKIFNENNIYNFNSSPNIQTKLLPLYILDSDLYNELENWIYYNQDENAYPELVIFNLGYFYGGSRDDSKYAKKYFRMEDCSSAIAKWLNSSVEFSTNHLEELYDDDLADPYSYEASKFLLPIKNQIPVAGDIFVYRKYDIEKDPLKLDRTYSKSGHTGIIVDYFEKDGDHYFEHLSYNRDIPTIEGLGYKMECMEEFPEKKYMFFEPIEFLGDVNYL